MLNDFTSWLDKEITALDITDNHNLFESGKHSEAVRIREKLRGTMESVDGIREQICDHYCRFPEAYPENDNERMMEERCEKCPLNKL